MTAHEESKESKDAQKDDWHASRSSVFILFQVNLLQAAGIMAKDSIETKRQSEDKPESRSAEPKL
jgi:hypothetical protein